MIKAILGKKLNMTQIFDNHGQSVPVTVIRTENNMVTAIKDGEKDGYKAVQIGYGQRKNPSKPLSGQLAKVIKKGQAFPAILKEVAFDNEVKVGQVVKGSDVFSKGSMVDVEGVSKGKGFAGVVKRHGFRGGPKTHGQSDRHRAPGSIGATTTPGRVFKGLRMAGHMGHVQVTLRGLQVAEIDDENQLILIKGSVPGPKGSLVLIKKSTIKRKKYHEPVIQAVNLGGGAEAEKTDEAVNEGQEVAENQSQEVAAEAVEVKEEVNGEVTNG